MNQLYFYFKYPSAVAWPQNQHPMPFFSRPVSCLRRRHPTLYIRTCAALSLSPAGRNLGGWANRSIREAEPSTPFLSSPISWLAVSKISPVTWQLTYRSQWIVRLSPRKWSSPRRIISWAICKKEAGGWSSLPSDMNSGRNQDDVHPVRRLLCYII